MSLYNSLYEREGHGISPNEPEKKGFARFCQMVGRDLGQLLGTNLIVCVLCLPAALGVSLGVTLFSLPITVVCSLLTGLLVGPAMLLLADCALRSLQNDPSQWLPRAKQTLAAHWKSACGFGCIGTLVLGLLCFVSAFVFEAAAQQGYYPGLAVLVFLALDFLVLAVFSTLCAAVLPLQAPDSLLRRAGRLLLNTPIRCVAAGIVMLAGIGGMLLLFPVSVFWAVLFGFWLPGLAAMQTLFPVLRQEYGVQVRTIPHPAAPDKILTAQEQKRRSRVNWWYYNWGIVVVAAMVIVGAAYVAHGLLTAVDPDYTVAVVTAEALPDDAVQRLQNVLTKEVETLTPETEEEFGNDPVFIYKGDITISGGYMNIFFMQNLPSSTDNKHRISLVRPQEDDALYGEDGYVHLELRYNDYDDLTGRRSPGAVSYNLNSLDIPSETKGIKLKLNSEENGEVEVTFDLKTAGSNEKLTTNVDLSNMQLK